MPTIDEKDRIYRKKPRLKVKEWAEIEALWATGNATLEELETKFDVNRTTISLRMKAKGITKGCKAEEHRRQVADEVARASTNDASVVAGRIRDTKEEHYKMSQGLAKLAWNEILEAKKGKVPLSTVTPNLKAIEVAMNVMQKARMERWAVLGLDKPDSVDVSDLPELMVNELTADQIQVLRDRDFREADEIDIQEVENAMQEFDDDEDDNEDD